MRGVSAAYRNPGGKSAILTAIVVGLGGRVQQTSRGTSLKDLIRKGSKYVPILFVDVLLECLVRVLQVVVVVQ